MKKVAFICVHNSCRSQMAEALGKHFAADVFESYSAGTETKPRINPDAVRLMKRIHGIDMEQSQYSKLLSDIPPVDVVITMGCNVNCPCCPAPTGRIGALRTPPGKPTMPFWKPWPGSKKRSWTCAAASRMGNCETAQKSHCNQ